VLKRVVDLGVDINDPIPDYGSPINIAYEALSSTSSNLNEAERNGVLAFLLDNCDDVDGLVGRTEAVKYRKLKVKSMDVDRRKRVVRKTNIFVLPEYARVWNVEEEEEKKMTMKKKKDVEEQREPWPVEAPPTTPITTKTLLPQEDFPNILHEKEDVKKWVAENIETWRRNPKGATWLASIKEASEHDASLARKEKEWDGCLMHNKKRVELPFRKIKAWDDERRKLEVQPTDPDYPTEIDGLNEHFLATGNLPHIVYCGPAAAGKSAVLELGAELFGDHRSELLLELNSADASADKIKNFTAAKRLLKPECPRVVVVVGAGSLTYDAQIALKRTIMDIPSYNVRLCFLCEREEDVVEAIKTKCLVIRETKSTRWNKAKKWDKLRRNYRSSKLAMLAMMAAEKKLDALYNRLEAREKNGGQEVKVDGKLVDKVEDKVGGAAAAAAAEDGAEEVAASNNNKPLRSLYKPPPPPAAAKPWTPKPAHKNKENQVILARRAHTKFIEKGSLKGTPKVKAKPKVKTTFLDEIKNLSLLS
jgi:hypothetical protein